MDNLMLNEFLIEAEEMLDTAEDGFLNLDNDDTDFDNNFNEIFRAFHSLKGAAGMFGLDSLQTHMHSLESLFESTKDGHILARNQVDYFLNGIDVARKLLQGEQAEFQRINMEQFLKLKNNTLEEVIKGQTSKVETPTKKESMKQIDIEIENETENVTSLTPKKKKRNSKGVIMIVDDEEDIIFILKSLIESEGFEAYTYLRADEALKDIERIRPDTVLSDIKMPGITGVEFTKKIHEIDSDIPVILNSAYITKDTVLEALSYGAYGFIEKPFKDAKVLSIVTASVKKHMAMKLLNKSINFILYQFSDLDQFLKKEGKETIRMTLKKDLQQILEQKKELQNLKAS